MKKAKKAFASLVIAGIVIIMIPFNALSADTIPTRIAGMTASQTAAAIAEQTGWSSNAILASSTSYGMVDALTAGPLSFYLKAPILLTGAGNALDASTKAELTKLNVKTIYVTSGTAVIKQKVLDELKNMGMTVIPLGGFDRFETAVNIAKRMSGVTKVAVANSIPDALSIASIASAANQPILLSDKDTIPPCVSAYLNSNPEITSSNIIGGTGVISDAVKAKFPKATRHAGLTAYDTNNQVIKDFASNLNFNQMYVANGVTCIDALAGAPLAAMTKSPVFLTNGVNVYAVPAVPADKITTVSTIDGKITVTLATSVDLTSSTITALGGTAVVPSNFGYYSIMKSSISDFAVTASGRAVTPTAISSGEVVVTLTVPTVGTTDNDQPGVYSVSFKGGNPVISNVQLSSTKPNNLKAGQIFNVVTYESPSTGYTLNYSTNDEAIKLVKKTYSAMSPPGIPGGRASLVLTFQAAQTGSYTLHFYRSRGGSDTIDPVDYIVNVN